MSTTNPAPAPSGKGRDRSLAPTFALLASCGMAAYGFSAKSALWSYYVPAALMLASAIWALWPRIRGRAA